MPKPLLIAFIFVILCACAAVAGLLYYTPTPVISASPEAVPDTASSVNEQVNQITRNLGTLE